MRPPSSSRPCAAPSPAAADPRPRAATAGRPGLDPTERRPLTLQQIALGLLAWIGIDILIVTAYAFIRARERS